jgi:hypothetical protein
MAHIITPSFPELPPAFLFGQAAHVITFSEPTSIGNIMDYAIQRLPVSLMAQLCKILKEIKKMFLKVCGKGHPIS